MENKGVVTVITMGSFIQDDMDELVHMEIQAGMT